jgi:hypothetical protein
MPVSNGVEDYFFGCRLRLCVGSALCREWFDWPILGDHVVSPCSRSMQAAEGTDVDETLHIVSQHTIHNVLRAADSATFIVVGAPLKSPADEL